MTPETLTRLRMAQSAGRPVALLTRLTDGAQSIFPDDVVAPELAVAADGALRDDRAQNLSLEGADWFIQPQNPALRLIVVGAVHVAQSLAPIAAAAGFAVTIVDPRRAFATADRFPGDVAMTHDWPDDAMEALAPDTRTAIVTLTHDPKLDDPALDRALASQAFYIGALGSRRTHAKRLDRLAELGHGPDAVSRIHAPVGLDIGAVTAPEIALSIIAQIVAVRRGKAA
ncbi:XdhC family protein [Humitalea sp. 24SJ18S-53]|uniref:XdhC family protein n=1 Tax=Humitalea sp. 24SJ18S-53 TaxID=3422307 RepID=UPI003D675AA3